MQKDKAAEKMEERTSNMYLSLAQFNNQDIYKEKMSIILIQRQHESKHHTVSFTAAQSYITMYIGRNTPSLRG